MRCAWEYNGNDTLIYSIDFVGAYARGESLEIAAAKMEEEIRAYAAWAGACCDENMELSIVQEKSSDLQIADADSDILLNSEKAPLTMEEYEALKMLVLKSAGDFHALYDSVPQKDVSCLPERRTFYGKVPRTAREMYEHTKNVNAYYFGEIGIETDNEGTILESRQRGFEQLEQMPGFLENPVLDGSYGEHWTLRKVMRRFLWHDRIHGKAMYRMAMKTFGAFGAENIFQFPENNR